MRRHALLVLLSFLAAEGARIPAAAEEPSFDCGKAASTAERLICSDGGLAALDRAWAEAFAQRRKAPGP